MPKSIFVYVCPLSEGILSDTLETFSTIVVVLMIFLAWITTKEKRKLYHVLIDCQLSTRIYDVFSWFCYCFCFQANDSFIIRLSKKEEKMVETVMMIFFFDIYLLKWKKENVRFVNHSSHPWTKFIDSKNFHSTENHNAFLMNVLNPFLVDFLGKLQLDWLSTPCLDGFE